MSDAALPDLSAPSLAPARSAADQDTWIASTLLLALVLVPHFPLRADPELNYGKIDAQFLLRMGLCVVCGLYGLAKFSRVRGLLNRFPLAWMVLLGAVAVATAPFSADPPRAMAAAAVLWSVLLFVPAALLQLGTRRALWMILMGSTVYLIGQWSMYFLAPEIGQGVELRPDGDPIYRVGADSQQLGFQSAVTVGLALIVARKGQLSRRWLWILLGLAAVTLAGAKSRTAVIVTVGGVGILLWRRLSPGRRALLVGGGVAICLAYLLLAGGISGVKFESVAAAVARSGTSEEVESLTGRREIWEFVVTKIEEFPVVGWGYCCSIVVCRDFDPLLRHAHNEVLNIALGLGIVGTIPLLGMFLQQVLRVWRTEDELPAFVTTAAIIAGLTEPVLFITMPTALLILWIIVLSETSNLEIEICGSPAF